MSNHTRYHIGNVKVQCSCIFCKTEITTSNLAFHFHLCQQHIFPKSPKNSGNCKHCGKQIRGYHKDKKEFCDHSCSASYTNAERIKNGYTASEKHREAARSVAKNFHTGPRVTSISRCKVCGKWFKGYNRACCSSTCRKQHQTKIAQENQLGKHGVRQKCKQLVTTDSYGNRVRLESSYEIRTAEILNDLGVSWIRPEPIHYVGKDGNEHRYYPDFFLPSSNLFLDPKNKYLYQKDKDKIDRVMSQNSVKVVMLSNDMISHYHIKSLI